MSGSGEPKQKLSRKDALNAALWGSLCALGATAVGSVISDGLEVNRISQNARNITDELNDNKLLNEDQKMDLMRKLHKEQKELGWDNLIAEGLPSEAFKSACRINVFDLSLAEGSASVLSLLRSGKKYRIIPSAGHILDIITENCLGVGLYRHEEMGVDTKNVLRRNQFGLAYTRKEGDFNTEEDFGFIVIEESIAIETGMADVYPWDEIASADDIMFEGLPQVTNGLYAIGFPGMLGIAPLACMDASIKRFEQSDSRNNLTLDNCLIYGGNSGTMVYWARRGGRAKIIGTMYAHFDVLNAASNDPNRIFADNANIFPISTLGREGFEKMLDDAILDLESRKIKS